MGWLIIPPNFKIGDLVEVKQEVKTCYGLISKGTLGVVLRVTKKTVKMSEEDISSHWVEVHLETGKIHGFFDSWLRKMIKDV